MPTHSYEKGYDVVTRFYGRRHEFWVRADKLCILVNFLIFSLPQRAPLPVLWPPRGPTWTTPFSITCRQAFFLLLQKSVKSVLRDFLPFHRFFLLFSLSDFLSIYRFFSGIVLSSDYFSILFRHFFVIIFHFFWKVWFRYFFSWCCRFFCWPIFYLNISDSSYDTSMSFSPFSSIYPQAQHSSAAQSALHNAAKTSTRRSERDNANKQTELARACQHVVEHL